MFATERMISYMEGLRSQHPTPIQQHTLFSYNFFLYLWSRLHPGLNNYLDDAFTFFFSLFSSLLDVDVDGGQVVEMAAMRVGYRCVYTLQHEWSGVWHWWQAG